MFCSHFGVCLHAVDAELSVVAKTIKSCLSAHDKQSLISCATCFVVEEQSAAVDVFVQCEGGRCISAGAL